MFGLYEFLPNDIEVCAIQLPGREERADERPYDDIRELVAKLADVMLDMVDLGLP